MPINSKAKGANGERALKQFFYDELGLYLTRNLDQTAKGGYDFDLRESEEKNALIKVPFAFECKRDEKLSTQAMWKQACSQTDKVCFVPVVIYKRNYKPWKAIMPECVLSRADGPYCPEFEYTIEVQLPLLIKICREWIV